MTDDTGKNEKGGWPRICLKSNIIRWSKSRKWNNLLSPESFYLNTAKNIYLKLMTVSYHISILLKTKMNVKNKKKKKEKNTLNSILHILF